MMYVAYFNGFSLPRQGVASRALRQAPVFSRAAGRGVYWLVALVDLGLGRAQLLPEGVPAVAYITYQLRRAWEPAPVETEEISMVILDEFRGELPAAVPSRALEPTRQLSQGRDYLLGQQQALYEKMTAGPWGLRATTETPLPDLETLSAAELTRELGGWTSPRADMKRIG